MEQAEHAVETVRANARALRQQARERHVGHLGDAFLMGCIAVVCWAHGALASSPATGEPAADAPIVTHTAVLETPEHTFVSRGEGLWLPRALALERARELAGLRARLALQTGDYPLAAPTWSVVLGFVGDFAIKAIGAVIVALKVCEVPGVCPGK